MAELKKDNNFISVSGGITDDASETVQPFRVNPATYRLLTDTSISSVTISGGTIDVLSSGTVNVSISSVSVSGGTINTLSAGTININRIPTLIISDGTISSGTINVSTGSIQLLNSSTLAGITGSVAVKSLIVSDGTISSGTVRVSGGSITITNSGGTAMAMVDAAGNLMVSLGTKLDSVNDSVTAVGTINVQTLTGGTINVSTGSIQLTGTSLVNMQTIGSNATGTVNVQVLSGGTIFSVGGVAHDSADSQNPLKIGAKATTSLSGLTMVAANDRTDLFAGTDGVLITRPYSNLEDISSGTASMTAAGSVAVITAAGAGIKTYLTDITLGNTGTGTTVVYLQDGSVCKWIIPAPPAGGATVHFTTPLPGTANTAWNVYMPVATTTLYASLLGFKSKI